MASVLSKDHLLPNLSINQGNVAYIREHDKNNETHTTKKDEEEAMIGTPHTQKRSQIPKRDAGCLSPVRCRSARSRLTQESY
jgi:hypothetical protein